MINTTGAAMTRGKTIIVNTHETDNQYAPVITSILAGSYMIAWHSWGQDGDGFGVYGQRFGPGGGRLGKEIQLNKVTASYQSDPVIDLLSTIQSEILVGWEGAGRYYSMQFINSNGQRDNDPIIHDDLLFNGENLGPTRTSLATYDDGSFLTVWQANTYNDLNGDFDPNTHWGVFGQKFDGTGQKIGGVFNIDDRQTSDEQHADVAIAANGRGMVVWISDQAGDGITDIYGRRLNANGVPVGEEFKISNQPVGDYPVPSVTALANGQFLVVWESENHNSIRAQKFSNSGTETGDEFQVNTTSGGYSHSPSATVLADGGYGIFWTDDVVRMQRYSADGVAVGGEQKMTDDEGSATGTPRAVTLPDGDLMLTWASRDGDSDGLAVLAQRFDGQWFGTRKANEIRDDLNMNWIDGMDGADKIFGGAGNDTLLGSGGSDILRGQADNDNLFGGQGADVLLGGSGNDQLHGGDGADRLSGSGGDDLLKGDAGDDRLAGNSGHDKLFAGDGADVLLGGGGNDILSGGGEDDALKGAAGNDRLVGGQGNDRLIGGTGADVFAFAKGDGRDRVKDFQAGTDQIEIGRGATGLVDLTLRKTGDNVVVSFKDVQIVVEDIGLNRLDDADNFLF
jgi:Ca2+-binding RTX toxin-like protein